MSNPVKVNTGGLAIENPQRFHGTILLCFSGGLFVLATLLALAFLLRQPVKKPAVIAAWVGVGLALIQSGKLLFDALRAKLPLNLPAPVPGNLASAQSVVSYSDQGRRLAAPDLGQRDLQEMMAINIQMAQAQNQPVVMPVAVQMPALPPPPQTPLLSPAQPQPVVYRLPPTQQPAPPVAPPPPVPAPPPLLWPRSRRGCQHRGATPVRPAATRHRGFPGSATAFAAT